MELLRIQYVLGISCGQARAWGCTYLANWYSLVLASMQDSREDFRFPSESRDVEHRPATVIPFHELPI